MGSFLIGEGDVPVGGCRDQLAVEGAQGYLASGKAEQTVEAAHRLGFSSVQCT